MKSLINSLKINFLQKYNMSFQKSLHILIPDGERVLSKFVTNCLSNEKNIKIHLLSINEKSSMKYSRYIESYTYIHKPENDKDWILIILDQIKKKNIDVLMPVEIENIQLITLHSSQFKSIVKMLVPPIESFRKTLDKWKFYKFLIENGIDSPATYLNTSGIINNTYKPSFPMLMKPKVGMGGFGIKNVQNIESVSAIFEENEDYMAQEFIEGFDIDMSVICKSGKILAYTIQKGYIFSSSKYSAALGVEFVFDESLFKTVSFMMDELNWTGFAHVDLRYETKSSKFKVLEINPRAWGSIEASQKVGVNFPYLYVLSCLEEDYELPKYKFETCTNSIGLLKVIKSNLSMGRKSIPFPDHSYVWNKLKDPLPIVYSIFSKKIKCYNEIV